ncbi:receptor-type guanylate cyclase gcy-4-like [Paramacrobiotus metropolitanus]|uniref:receptor-type guanylate cyclase gcy-4-like n=1 Tax=Paramacrobiotus metropolitanus TaxID=2943436 RepID=UPI002445988C|nr:receptor-type guanylate cyclase gcy-4-like [Paramacrobiotus metropolitanus]
MDFLEGLSFIHHSKLHYHGRLSIFSCWIDKNFTLKLMNLATDRILDQMDNIVTVGNEYNGIQSVWEEYFWFVPEQNEIDQWDRAAKSMQAVDIFSAGLVLYDILTGGCLYKKMQDTFDPATFFNKDDCHDNPLTAAVDYMHVAELATVIHSCLSNAPENRPNVKQLCAQLKELSPLLAPELNQDKLFDKVYRRFCLYSNRLEREVAARSKELREARRRCDALVRQFLPREIVDKLRNGQFVEPELFDCVTIMFTQINELINFARAASPEEVIALVSKTEDFLDLLSTTFNVYKVEAVMDSFLVASGLPNRIGAEHVRRVANFALRVLELEPMLELPQQLSIKTGMHSGPCAAGVIGVRRPRYCIFGDTINVASRMCSQGMPGRIHLSHNSALLLKEFEEYDYIVVLRGLLKVKGRGDMTTYWLFSKTFTPALTTPTRTKTM